MFKKPLVIALLTASVSISSADVINIYAHRGIRPISPENTLPSYTAAIAKPIEFYSNLKLLL